MKTLQEASDNYVDYYLSTIKAFPIRVERRGLFNLGKVAFRAGVEFAQRWIPVGEELPEKDVDVLVLVKQGSIDPVYRYFISHYDGRRFHIEMDWFYVVKWRPLEYK